MIMIFCEFLILYQILHSLQVKWIMLIRTENRLHELLSDLPNELIILGKFQENVKSLWYYPDLFSISLDIYKYDLLLDQMAWKSEKLKFQTFGVGIKGIKRKLRFYRQSWSQNFGDFWYFTKLSTRHKQK